MPRLGEIIEALVGDLYSARALNDARAAEIFELYKDNETMRNLAMPVFRIGKMDVSLPLRALSVEASGDIPDTPKAISPDRSVEEAVMAIGSLYKLVAGRSLTSKRVKDLSAAFSNALRKAARPLVGEAIVELWVPIVLEHFRRWRISAKTAGINDIENHLSRSLIYEQSGSSVETQRKNMLVDFVKSQEDIPAESLFTLKFEIREHVARWQLVTGEEEGEFREIIVVE